MHSPGHLLLIIVLAGLVSVFQLLRALSTGRSPLWPGGTATRKGQPTRYWRFVYSAVVVIAGCVAVSAWVILEPAAFR